MIPAAKATLLEGKRGLIVGIANENSIAAKAPARSLVAIEDVGVATAFLAHDAARLITGETLYADGGYHIID